MTNRNLLIIGIALVTVIGFGAVYRHHKAAIAHLGAGVVIASPDPVLQAQGTATGAAASAIAPAGAGGVSRGSPDPANSIPRMSRELWLANSYSAQRSRNPSVLELRHLGQVYYVGKNQMQPIRCSNTPRSRLGDCVRLPNGQGVVVNPQLAQLMSHYIHAGEWEARQTLADQNGPNNSLSNLRPTGMTRLRATRPGDPGGTSSRR